MDQTIGQPRYKEEILAYLKLVLRKKSKEFAHINTWGADVCKRLISFVSHGKMIRGSLVFFSYSLFSEKKRADCTPVAAAIELLHSSLLVHDDIMDQDAVRRGKKSIFAQYTSIAEKRQFHQTLHFGESMGICFGDIGFFLAYELLANTSVELLTLFSKELSSVVLAQMQDVYNGFVKGQITQKNILTVYTYKTGRYTFSLPLMSGALLAHQSQKIVHLLEKIGQEIGVLFQLRDDELGLFGDEKNLGKPIGSDIWKNKKTVYRLLLFAKAVDKKKKLEKLFGNQKLSSKDIVYVQNLLIQLGIREEMQVLMQKIGRKAKALIRQLPIASEKKKAFLDVVDYARERSK